MVEKLRKELYKDLVERTQANYALDLILLLDGFLQDNLAHLSPDVVSAIITACRALNTKAKQPKNEDIPLYTQIRIDRNFEDELLGPIFSRLANKS